MSSFYFLSLINPVPFPLIKYGCQNFEIVRADFKYEVRA